VKLSHIALGSAIALSVVGSGILVSPASAQDDCVTISGGNIVNQTSIDINANAGTAISDASAGSNNTAQTGGRNLGVDTASAGNGGVATSSANGGAISTGNINSGGNVGNAVSVGNTYCAAPVANAEAPKAEKAEKAGKAEAAVVSLPSTGVGVGELNGLLALLASAGAAAASFGLRRR
jgi:hypothetical protein